MSLKARFRHQLDDFELNVDLEIPSDGTTALFGPSGAGKSTVLRVICGLERPHSAKIQFRQGTWHDSQQRIFMPTHKRPIGYVIQEPSLFAHLNVLGNLDFAKKRALSEQINFGEIVALLGIQSLLSRSVRTLSGGEKQRVAIARALLTGPKLLLLDEPLSALDLHSKREIMPYLERLSDELRIPIIYVSHQPDEIMRLADHLALIRCGQILKTGPLQAMLTELDAPLLEGHDVASLISATVEEIDPEFGLMRLGFSGGSLTMTASDESLGREARVQIRADDVSLVLAEPCDTSILNILPVEVVDVAADENSPAQVLVKLRAGEEFLISRITRKSATSLDIAIGKKLYAQIKSVALVG